MDEKEYTTKEILQMSMREFELLIENIRQNHSWDAQDKITEMERRHEDELKALRYEIHENGKSLAEKIQNWRDVRAEAARDE